MRPGDLAALEKIPKDKLAECWATLNKWEWPEYLPDPISFLSPRSRQADSPERIRAWEIMCWIRDKIWDKECMRAWNKERMSAEEF